MNIRSKANKNRYIAISCAISCWLTLPMVAEAAVDYGQTNEVFVIADRAQEQAKYNPQQVTVITKAEIEKKQAKSVEDIIFNETGVSRTVDAMGRVGVSIRGAEARHTLILIDGQPVMGDFDKFSGAADEVMRLGTENLERIEIVQGAASAKYGANAIGGVVNIITKKASKKQNLQFNAEGLRRKKDGDIAPYSNIFFRADSGEMGKLRLGLMGSRRDIMPVLASEDRRVTDKAKTGDYYKRSFDPNVLRYHGIAADIGLVGTYEANKNNIFEFRINHYNEELGRQTKKTDNDLEPIQNFKRHADRDTASLSWSGKKGASSWTVETNYSRIKEDDVALMSYTGRSQYEGSNELRYIDNIDHSQYSIDISANTNIGDSHSLSYGVGYIKEKGTGSRLKSSPNTSTMYIDPWNYDKSLLVDKIDRMNRREGDNSLKVFSHIHDYKFKDNKSGMPEWDTDYEYYGYDAKDDKSFQPKFTYDDYLKYGYDKEGATRPHKSPYSDEISTPSGLNMPLEKYKEFEALENRLKSENAKIQTNLANIVKQYFDAGDPTASGKIPDNLKDKIPVLNGKKFLEEYQNRSQRITVGSGTIEKEYVYLADNWQINDNTIVVPILRYDHSNLFGSHLSATLGMTHNVNGNAHRRFKVNVGTGYNEPGMGELWYNWEMYSSTQINLSQARLGWYWVGNPNLKPEKSINFDISLEGENKNTTLRAGVFYNRIKDYMSVYFTGTYIDFAPFLKGEQKVSRAPDMIYSFKNIGRAEITGLEMEARQKFGKYWSGRLGYTYLHAINKSDPLMPRQLLDKPVHKVDIGLSYENKKTGWGGQIWGNYYIDMLDRNSPADNRNLYPDILEGDASVFRKQAYEKKTFGIWNVMLQKKINKDSLVYVGVNNLFNHRDDDRATQERVYRFGVNLKFGANASDKDKSKAVNGALPTAEKPMVLENFLARPFVEGKEKGLEALGDYRLRWNSHEGTNRPHTPYRANTYINSANYNMLDKNEHSFEQRLRFGAEARLSDTLNLRVMGSASGQAGIDTGDYSESNKALSRQRLEEVDLTKKAKKWDLSFGRLGEPLGITGYWFGKEFDGIRAVWTGKDAQVRVGYGDFTHSTGISNSAYTHSVYGVIYRPPTVQELIGINRDDFPYDLESATKTGSSGVKKSDKDAPEADSPNGIYESTYKGTDAQVYFYQQLKAAKAAGASDAEINQIINRLYQVVSKAYGSDLTKEAFSLNIPHTAKVVYELRNKATGEVKYKMTDVNYSDYISPWDSEEEKVFKTAMNKRFTVSMASNDALLDGKSYIEGNKDLTVAYREIAEYSAKTDWSYYKGSELSETYKPTAPDDLSTGTKVTDTVSQADDYEFVGVKALLTVPANYSDHYKDGVYHYNPSDVVNELVKANYTGNEGDPTRYGMELPKVAYNYLDKLERVARAAEQENKQPRTSLGNIVGNIIKTEGTILEKDTIPALDRAAFIQAKKQFGDRLGLQAWYLRSTGHDNYKMTVAKDKGNETTAFDRLANVFGIGAVYQVGKKAKLSVDYGQNRSDFGRYMNGRTMYEHERGTADFKVRGREVGKTPTFWTVRLDVGQSDMDHPGSWNAYIDYKHFEHGAFFGGNGTEAVPDRYLDGIRSFTLGTGYVPAKDVLLELFYTFDAKGTSSRDTLFGPEQFRLGNYARLQGTYKF